MAYFDDRNNFNEDLVVENVKLKEKILIFLEEKGFVEDLERDCVGFHQKVPVSNFNPFFVNFSLKFCDLNDADLIYLVTKEPKQFKDLVEEITRFLVNGFFARIGSVVRIQKQQIHIAIRFFELPLIPEFQFSLKAVHINCALTTFHCILSSKSLVEQYCRHSVWKCSNCEESPTIIQKSGDKINCRNCDNECTEIVSLRVTSSVRSVRGFEVRSFENHRVKRPSVNIPIDLKLFDDLCQDLHLGHEYIAIGIFNPFKNFFNVWSIVSATEN